MLLSLQWTLAKHGEVGGPADLVFSSQQPQARGVNHKRVDDDVAGCEWGTLGK
jgi:hypothetical protein